MTRNWWLVIALVLSLGINAGWILKGLMPDERGAEPAAVPAGPDAERWPERPGERRSLDGAAERIADRLELEGDRRQAFIELQVGFIEQVQEAHRRSRLTREKLRTELLADEPDRARIDELLAEANRATLDLERAFVDNVLSSRELLEPWQEERYLRFVHRLRERGLRGRMERLGKRSPRGAR